MSLIKAIKAQLGLSVTPANNFTLDASADNGTMKLARNSGQDIMTVAADGKVAFPQNPAPSFSAQVNAMTQQFANNVPAKVIGYTVKNETPNSGFNPATGNFVAPRDGWYSFSAWISCGASAASLSSAQLVFEPGNSLISVAESRATPAAGYVGQTVGAVLRLSAGNIVSLRVYVTWGDAGTHPFTDGALTFSGSWLHE
jgi:hypothetical protein